MKYNQPKILRQVGANSVIHKLEGSGNKLNPNQPDMHLTGARPSTTGAYDADE